MLTITNGRDELTVTHGAYLALYKSQGFYPAAPKKEGLGVAAPEPSQQGAQADKVHDIGVAEVNTDSETENEPGDDLWKEVPEDSTAYEETPLSQMNRSQLMAYADTLGVEYTGEETKAELRTLIRAYR